MVGAGTGNDFKFFPPHMNILAIDISPKMLERAARKRPHYQGSIELRQMDVCEMDFADATFDGGVGLHLLFGAEADRRPS